jgi:2-phosphosulfolactate phosphatase
VIPAGERWDDSDALRPAIEDLVGAGAVICHLAGSLSPEARLAVNAFTCFKEDLFAGLGQCSSGKELIAKGFQEDVLLASELDVDPCAPRYSEGAYITAE